MNIAFDKEFKAGVPGFKMILIEADVCNPPTGDALWHEIEKAYSAIASSYPIEEIRRRPAIDATRAAYKQFGKDPNRYRPSAEALCRRAVRGLDLYRTLSIIDLTNLVSILTGHSIGAFDADKIVGPTLTLGVGAHEEPYEAIGRGELNIEGLPVYRDAVGGIGTPTSDNERTKLSEQTSRLVVTLNIYGDEPEYPADRLKELFTRLLTDYASARNITITEISSDNENN